MSYEEAKMLCEKAQEKSSLASSILKKYREKYGDDEFLKGLPPLFVRESQNYKQHVMESDKAFKELQSINTWFMKNFKKNISIIFASYNVICSIVKWCFGICFPFFQM